jgi:hypothetical protein
MKNHPKQNYRMAASTVNNSHSTPNLSLPKDSKLKFLVDVARRAPSLRKSAIAMARKVIKNAKSMKDLGYSEQLYDRTHAPLITANMNNYDLTLSILHMDEGLYGYLLNKVSSLIRNGHLSARDHLCIINWHRVWVFDALSPMDEDGECLLGNHALNAVTRYRDLLM